MTKALCKTQGAFSMQRKVSNMGHNHSVHDSDAHFSINPITRQIRNDGSKKVTLIQGDHNSERFTFELPQYIEGHDMSQCNKVEVHFLNIDNATKEKISGVYTVDDLKVSTDKPDMVQCSWLVSQNATQYVGNLNFLLKLACVEGDIVQYAWHTAVCVGISVSDGINGGEALEEDYLDIIEQWKATVIRDITNDVNAGVSEWAETESGKLRGMLYTETAKTNADLAVERARIDQMVSGVTADDAELIDIRVGADGVTYDSAGTAVREQVSKLTDVCNGINKICKTNLFDVNAITKGGYIGADGVMVTSKHFETDFIECNPGDVIRVIRAGAFYEPNGNIVACYDAAKNFIKTRNIAYPVTITTSQVPELRYIRIPLDNFCLNDWIMITRNDETLYSEFIPFVENVGSLKNEMDTLAGRVTDLETLAHFENCMQLGDSITWYDGRILSGTDEVAYGYASYLRELGITVDNSGVNGACVAYHAESPYKDIVTTVDEKTDFDDYDLITIAGGVNDYQSFPSPLGEFTSGNFDVTTFTGAYQQIIETILTQNPLVQLVLFTPLKCYNKTGKNTLGYTLEDYVDRIMEIGKYYSIPVLDLYSNGGMNAKNVSALTLDKLHPNNSGYRFVSGLLMNFIRNLK